MSNYLGVQTENTEKKMKKKTWFASETRLGGLAKICVNYITENVFEIDVLSVAKHYGISDVTEFITSQKTQTALRDAFFEKNKKKIIEKAEIIVRYHNCDEESDAISGIVIYKPLPPGETTPRWCIPGILMKPLQKLLGDYLVDGIKDPPLLPPKVEKKLPPLQDCGKAPVVSDCGVITFRSEKRELFSISASELEEAEKEVNFNSLIDEIFTLRKVMLKNSENALGVLQMKIIELENQIKDEQTSKFVEISELNAQISALRKLTRQSEHQGKIFFDEEAGRQRILSEYTSELLIIIPRGGQQNVEPPPTVMVKTTIVSSCPPLLPSLSQSEEILNQKLIDAQLEIERLKKDSKVKFKITSTGGGGSRGGGTGGGGSAAARKKNPDIKIATETDIRNTVKLYMSSKLGGEKISSSKGIPAGFFDALNCGGITIQEKTSFKDREMAEGRILVSLSRQREEDLCCVETASETLQKFVDNLSSNLTAVLLIIDEIKERRIDIMNKLDVFSFHHKGIVGILKIRPYFLGLARQMNPEKKPLVRFESLRALINVSVAITESLKEIDKIEIKDLNLTPLEEAAARCYDEANDEFLLKRITTRESQKSTTTRRTASTFLLRPSASASRVKEEESSDDDDEDASV